MLYPSRIQPDALDICVQALCVQASYDMRATRKATGGIWMLHPSRIQPGTLDQIASR